MRIVKNHDIPVLAAILRPFPSQNSKKSICGMLCPTLMPGPAVSKPTNEAFSSSTNADIEDIRQIYWHGSTDAPKTVVDRACNH